jgi:hypothetical protein
VIEVTYFPKICACCGTPLYRVQKIRMSWYECRLKTCLVNLLEEQELEEAERAYRKRKEARNHSA